MFISLNVERFTRLDFVQLTRVNSGPMNTIPTKQEVMRALGVRQADLAGMLGITRAAVSHWPDDEPIPELRWLQLKHQVAPSAFARAA